jgi:transposase-like protein
MTPHLAAVERALVDAGGSVAAAARKLGIASAELRGWVRSHRLLADAVFEQIELEIDAAHKVLRDGLRSDNAMTRMRAATYILRYTEAGRRRWGPRGSSHDEPVEPQTVTLKWIDT